MLKLTQVHSQKYERIIYVAAAHVVAIYPDTKGYGCHIKLTTDTNPEELFLHVCEDAEAVASHQFLNTA